MAMILKTMNVMLLISCSKLTFFLFLLLALYLIFCNIFIADCLIDVLGGGELG